MTVAKTYFRMPNLISRASRLARMVLLFGFTSISALAQETASVRAAGSLAELSGQLQRGDRIRVRDVGGNWMSGRFDRVSGGTFRFEGSRGDALDLSEAMLSEVRRKRPESAWNGVLIGLGIGLGAAAIGTRSTCGDDSECAFYAAWAFFPTLAGGGAAVGAIVDRAVSKYDTVYTSSRVDASTFLRVSPYVTRHERGIRLSVSF